MKNKQTLKIKRPSYVIAETSKAQREILNILTDMGYYLDDKYKLLSTSDLGLLAAYNTEELTYEDLLKQHTKVIL